MVISISTFNDVTPTNTKRIKSTAHNSRLTTVKIVSGHSRGQVPHPQHGGVRRQLCIPAVLLQLWCEHVRISTFFSSVLSNLRCSYFRSCTSHYLFILAGRHMCVLLSSLSSLYFLDWTDVTSPSPSQCYPAEVFPTRFRASAHGLSAASGKAGAIISALAFNALSESVGTPVVLWSESSLSLRCYSLIQIPILFCRRSVRRSKPY